MRGSWTLDFASPSSSRVVLVERFRSSREWEEAPEDLALSLLQLSALTRVMASSGIEHTLGPGKSMRAIGIQLLEGTSRSFSHLSKNIVSMSSSADAGSNFNSNSRSRGVDFIVNRYAEECATSLMGTGLRTGSVVAESEEDQEACVLSVLRACIRSIGSSGGDRSTEVQGFVWRMVRTCCTDFKTSCVIAALNAVCTTEVLREMLKSVSASWHADGGNRDTAVLIFDWISSLLELHHAGEKMRNKGGAIQDILMTRDAVLSAVSALSAGQRKGLVVAVEFVMCRHVEKLRILQALFQLQS